MVSRDSRSVHTKSTTKMSGRRGGKRSGTPISPNTRPKRGKASVGIEPEQSQSPSLISGSKKAVPKVKAGRKTTKKNHTPAKSSGDPNGSRGVNISTPVKSPGRVKKMVSKKLATPADSPVPPKSPARGMGKRLGVGRGRAINKKTTIKPNTQTIAELDRIIRQSDIDLKRIREEGLKCQPKELDRMDENLEEGTDQKNDDDSDQSEMHSNVSQTDNKDRTMDDGGDYTATEYDNEEQDDDLEKEEDEDDVLPLESDDEKDQLNSSALRMVHQNASLFNDPTKSAEEWWTEDRTREGTLCDLWEESKWLYDFRDKGHHREDKDTTLRRFSTILEVPREYIEFARSIQS